MNAYAWFFPRVAASGRDAFGSDSIYERCTRAASLTYRTSRAPRQRRAAATALALAGALGLAFTPLVRGDERPGHYQQTNLVSDVPGLAAVTDPHLVNPWGLARSATSPWWVSDNGTGLTTLYNGAGAVQPLVVTLPNVPGVSDPSAPTGTVFNGVPTDFLVAPGKPARFIFAHEEGTLTAWNSGTQGVLMVNNAGTGAVYKGLAIATMGGAQYLYAANFGNVRIDVFDSGWNPVTLAPGAFQDPKLPANYAPFGVQALGGMLYVTFARQQPGSIDELHGPGKGFVDVFATDGTLQMRLRWGAWMNAPWGVALAPADFGRLSHRVLVGQFGSGKIATFDAESGAFKGLMRGPHGRPVLIEGLWGLGFGNGANAGPANTLYFSAGIDDEAHGLFGTLTPVTRPGHHDADGDDAGGSDSGK